MAGASGRTHCGRWRPVAYGYYNTTRLVCSLPPFHRGLHLSRWSGWMWRDATDRPVRDWTCNGLVDETSGQRCGQAFQGTEAEARVSGWRIGVRNGQRDPLCPACGKPDPVTVGLVRDLERSLRRH